jgi:tetratricopeptide (TPR) repeat protein
MSIPHCKYHPKEFASWFCPHCKVNSCLNCVTDLRGDLFPACTLCRKTLTSLSIARGNHKPNAGNLLSAILQPKNLLLTIFAAGLLTTIMTLVSNDWIKHIALALCLIPFASINFYLMEKLANNEVVKLRVSNISEYLNSQVIIKFIVYLIMAATILSKSLQLSGLFGNLISSWIIFGSPASLIIIMIEKRFFSSLNPLKIFEIVRVFSFNYIVIFICWSLSVFLWLLPFVLLNDNSSFYIVQSFICLLFSLLMFQLVFWLKGMFVFSHHVELNYSLRSTTRSSMRTTRNDSLVDVNIYIQEGRFEDASKILWEMIEQSQSLEAYEKLVLLYHYQGKNSYRDKLILDYLAHLQAVNNIERAKEFYLKLAAKNIECKPSDKCFAVEIAKAMHTPENFENAIGLLQKYPCLPSSGPSWDLVAFQLAQLKFEFAQDDVKSLELLNMILKRAFDQEILKATENYKKIVEEN